MRAHPSLKVARVVVPIGAHEVPVLAEQRGRQAVDAGVVQQGAQTWGYIRLSLFSTAQPLYTRFPIIFSSCFSEVTIGCSPAQARVAVEEGHDAAAAGRGVVRLAVLPAAIDLARSLEDQCTRSATLSRQKNRGQRVSQHLSTAD
jgi:hypothetical protein